MESLEDKTIEKEMKVKHAEKKSDGDHMMTHRRPKLVKKFIQSVKQHIRDKEIQEEERWARLIDGQLIDVDVQKQDCQFSYFYPAKPQHNIVYY